jgi:hypothetical protein
MKRPVLILLLASLPLISLGNDCAQLTNNQRIIRYVNSARSSNPLLRKKISVLIETNPCEKELCLRKNIQKRHQNKQVIHIVRFDRKKRLNFVEGANAPQCFVEIGEKEFKCDSCEQQVNYNCRSYKSSGSSARFKGTNINSDDLDLLSNEQYQSVCQKLPEAPTYFKIITSTSSGASGYDKIETYYEKARKLPVLINFYAENRLHKVYRFFISRYFMIDGEWYSTFIRVRSTLGREKFFEFETIVRVLKNDQGKFHLFVDPKNDPLISRGNQDDLFRTD